MNSPLARSLLDSAWVSWSFASGKQEKPERHAEGGAEHPAEQENRQPPPHQRLLEGR